MRSTSSYYACELHDNPREYNISFFVTVTTMLKQTTIFECTATGAFVLTFFFAISLSSSSRSFAFFLSLLSSAALRSWVQDTYTGTVKDILTSTNVMEYITEDVWTV